MWKKIIGFLKKVDNNFIVMFLAVFLMVWIRLIPNQYFWDTIIIISILLVSVFIYLHSYSSKYKWLLKLMALYIFINFLFFPASYTILLKIYPDSFQVENSILNSEKRNSLNALNENYDPTSLEKKLKIINGVLNDSSENLDIKISTLNKGNVVKVNSYFLAKDCESIRAHRPMYASKLNICDLTGKHLTELKNNKEGCKLNYENKSIRFFVHLQKTAHQKRLKEFISEKKSIVQDNNYWSFHQLLAYSVNIFSTGNLIPISKFANILFHLHSFLGNLILLTLLIGGVQKELEKRAAEK